MITRGCRFRAPQGAVCPNTTFSVSRLRAPRSKYSLIRVNAGVSVADLTEVEGQVFSEQQFNDFLSQNKSSTVVIDFYTSWCGPCKMIAPKVEALADELKDIKFAKINLEKCESGLSKTLGIKSLPTFVAYKNGEKEATFVGANYEKWRQWVFCFV
jgi:thioredoxin 1